GQSGPWLPVPSPEQPRAPLRPPKPSRARSPTPLSERLCRREERREPCPCNERIINLVICGALKSTWSNILFGSAGALRSPCQLRISPVDPFQHISHLGRGDRHRPIRRRGPEELSAA